MRVHFIFVPIGLIFFFGFLLLQPYTISAASAVDVTFIGVNHVELSSLIEGVVGEGWLLYSRANAVSQHPGMVVHLSKITLDGPVHADIYQLPENETSLTITGAKSLQEISKLKPVVVSIIGLDGWWVRNGIPSYNLDIQVKGPFYAMWGAGYDTELGPQGWASEIKPGQLAVTIEVRDEDKDGIPDWELRQLRPEFSGYAVYRVDYAERKCKTETKRDWGIFPQWPYIASSGGYEQLTGVFRPPIVV